jgi:outer membrane receptor for ferrienterochelin and colicins
MFNAWQQDFDLGKNRDSNFMYGPAQPFSVFFGMRFRSE